MYATMALWLLLASLVAGRTEHAYSSRANKAGWKADTFGMTAVDVVWCSGVLRRDC
jgi:uncharacterized membrane protein YecN with MAPEG domain